MTCQICSEPESVDNVLIKSCFNDECHLKNHEKCLIESVKNNKMYCQCGEELNFDKFKKLNLVKCFSESSICCYKIFLHVLILTIMPILELGIDVNSGVMNSNKINQFTWSLSLIIANIILIMCYI